MLPKSTDRDLTTTSIEERLRASLSAPISDEAESTIQRIAELARSAMRRRREVAESLFALIEIFRPTHQWSFAKSVIGSAIGKDSRTVQRLLCRPNKKTNAGGELQWSPKKQTPDQGFLVTAESGVNSETAECLSCMSQSRVLALRSALCFVPLRRGRFLILRAWLYGPKAGLCISNLDVSQRHWGQLFLSLGATLLRNGELPQTTCAVKE